MKRRKRLVGALLTGCMVVSMFPTFALADEQQSETKTLQSQIDAVEDNGTATITLDKDYTESITIPEGKTITLDLNGHKIVNSGEAQTSGNDRNHTITNKGSLTIIGDGTVDNVSHQKAAVYNMPNAKVMLKGGTFTRSEESGTSSTDSGNNSFYTLKNFGEMEINDGVIVNQGADGNGKFSSLVANGYQDGSKHDGLNYTNYGTPTLTINGGTFNGGLNTIKNDDYGVLTINGGTFQNVAQAAFLNWNEAIVNDGIFISEQYCILNGYANDTMDKGNLTINGGSFTAAQEKNVISQMGSSTSIGDVSVSGGDYSSSVSEYVIDTLKAELVRTSSDTPYSYYADVAAAQKAAGTEDTINDLSVEKEENTTYHKVTLNYNDGVSAQVVTEVKKNETYTLPTTNPTRPGYTFQGWYNGNTKVEKEITVTDNVTLTAKWSRNGGTVTPTYTSTVDKTENGTVTVSAASSKQGDTVTITTKPNEGYEVESVTVTDANGNKVEVKDNGNGTYTFTQPNSNVTIKVAYAEISCKKDSTCPISKFTDADPKAWYHDGVHYCIDTGLMAGIGNAKFQPNGVLTRAQLAQILYNKAGKPAVSQPSTFTDVPANQWYANAIAWAQQNKVVSGIGGNKFAPDEKITREQIAAMLYRNAGSRPVTGTLNFKDAANVSEWAKDAMLWATQNKVINGALQSDGTLLLNAKLGASRAETATMLENYYNK